MSGRRPATEEARALRQRILDQVIEYHELVHAPRRPFEPGTSRVPYAGRVYDERELVNLVDAALEFWLTAGRYSARFEHTFSRRLGVEHCMLTNSGSSANLLALAALTSPSLGPRRLCPGDEVVTVAAGFATTVFPIVQCGAIPVFVDVVVDDGSYNIDVTRLADAIGARTRAVMIAHTLGNPIDVDAVLRLCRAHDLWFIEDNCDALGSTYRGRSTGGFGDVSTSSFYPPHHITMGEGGAVCTSSSQLAALVRSFRDWGRDCHCNPGCDNTCGARFDGQYGELPHGYDHKYVFRHMGYNLKPTDLQAAIGVAQLDKLDDFVSARRRNWQALREGVADLEDRLVLPNPTADSAPSWFGFALTVRPGAGLRRAAVVAALEARGIQTRLLFAGNMVRQPCFDELRATGTGYRVVGELRETDRIMNDTFWVGVYPGMQPAMIDYMIETLHDVVR